VTSRIASTSAVSDGALKELAELLDLGIGEFQHFAKDHLKSMKVALDSYADGALRLSAFAC